MKYFKFLLILAGLIFLLVLFFKDEAPLKAPLIKKTYKPKKSKKHTLTDTTRESHKDIESITKNTILNFEEKYPELCNNRNKEFMIQKKVCEESGGLWSCLLFPSCMSAIENYELLSYVKNELSISNIKATYLKKETKIYCQMMYGNDHCLMDRPNIVESYKCKQYGENKVWSPRYGFCTNKKHRKQFKKLLGPCLFKEDDQQEECLNKVDSMVNSINPKNN